MPSITTTNTTTTTARPRLCPLTTRRTSANGRHGFRRVIRIPPAVRASDDDSAPTTTTKGFFDTNPTTPKPATSGTLNSIDLDAMYVMIQQSDVSPV